MRLTWHDYRYYPYERELARREIAGLFANPRLAEAHNGVELHADPDHRLVDRLTYFSKAVNGTCTLHTAQSRLEGAVRRGKSRQATRYSVHGMHEYKGKFNPQVVRAMLNIFNVGQDQTVLDPFCGSGTTLVECSHIGAKSCGVDLNPFAVFLTNAKLLALSFPASRLMNILKELELAIASTTGDEAPDDDNERCRYLRSWFSHEVLSSIETVRRLTERVAGDVSPVFLSIASNLLRDYSLQDPKDLRIRRRRSPLPETSFEDTFIAGARECIDRIGATQEILGMRPRLGQACLSDAASLDLTETYDAAITSPPYAMALPYIDTQRLSLVWLDLAKPRDISGLEAELIGSREMRGSPRRSLADALTDNHSGLPDAQAGFCVQLQDMVGREDGFRRQAVPVLLYRYFASMMRSFRAVRGTMRPRAPFALIVGHNHTVLDGVRRDIDTPAHLAGLASHSGWLVEESVPLQTYRRYGYHMNNAVGAETLLVLRKP
ncbi:MAG: RNA methylase [Boseongicola sp. SB0677_bin_26]|nr:RNA methylase [Boseongicola sp. SB0665_bin_10]MYG25064.1 RNA methylase [Boseongicola sp. SB0677_bin_26]